jgi:hypothetical protein
MMDEEQKPQEPNADAQEPTEERKSRQKILDRIPDSKRTFFNIARPRTPQEWIEQLLLAQAKDDYLEGKPIRLDSLKSDLVPPPPSAPEDRLDRFRVILTIVMVAGLFLIVAVIVFRPTTPSGIYQLVALASGLAGIGLGWLFGSATARSKNSP